MSIEILDTLDGVEGTPITGRSGQVGASWEVPSWLGSGQNQGFYLSGAGRAYSTVFSYGMDVKLASGVPAGSEYDVRARMTKLSGGGSADNNNGIVFRASASQDSKLALAYEWGAGWYIYSWDNGARSSLGNWADPMSGTLPLTRELEIRIRDTSPRISVRVDGVERITSDSTYAPGNRIGLYQSGGSPQGSGGGIQFDEIAAGSAGFLMPVYEVTGPAVITPDYPSKNFVVSLMSGANPGSITITPSVSGMAGVFTPASVTLTDADRVKTFTFTPTGEGSGTINYANNGGVSDHPAMAFTAGFLPPERLSFYATTFTKFMAGGSSPYVPGTTEARGTGGSWMDGDDHYDPPHCYRRMKRWAVRNGIVVPSVAPEVQAGMVRIRDRAVNALGSPGWANNGRAGDWDDREGKGVQWYHRKLDGIAEHFLETGDPRCIEAAMILAGDDVAPDYTFSLTDNTIGVMREIAFLLQSFLARYRMGLGIHPKIDDAARVLLWMVDLIAVPYADKKYGIWLKPFMGGLLARALITYWEMFRDEPSRAELIGVIPGRLKAFSDYMAHEGGGGQPPVWWAPGTDWGNGWIHGSVSYRDLQNDDPKFVPIGPGLAITQVINPRYQFRGPASLSTVDQYYQYANFSVDGIADGYTIINYVGATREITLGGYRPGRDITLADTFALKPSGYVDWEGAGPAAELNGMVAPLDAWCYWHEKVVLGNAAGSYAYRERFHDKFNGNYQSWEQAYGKKQWNQSFIWLTDGLDWAARADGPDWPEASGLTLQAPRRGTRVFSGRRSGTFRISVPYGQRLDVAEEVTPLTTGTGTFSGPEPLLTTTEPLGAFTITPAVGEIGSAPVVSAVGAELDADASFPLDVRADEPRPAACTFYVASGPKQSGAGVEGERILITLGHGTVGGTVRITPAATGGGGTFNPAFLDLSDLERSKWTKFTPTGAGARTVTFSNNGGLADAAPLPYQTDPYTYAAKPGYTITGPGSGEVYSDAEFTVALGAGDLPYSADPVNPGTYRFVPYASAEFEGLGEFFPEYFDLTDQRRSATFKYKPFSTGARTIGFFGPADLTEAAWKAFEATPEAGEAPATGFTVAGPSTGLVGVQSGLFTIALWVGSVSGTVRFTPTASPSGGTFSPTFVDLDGTTRAGTFRYTAPAAGVRTISATNDGGLTLQGSGVSYTASEDEEPMNPVVNYTLTGPTGGEVNAQSSAFTITLGDGTLSGTARFTPTASAGTGIFIPAYIDLTDSTRAGSFVFIPTSVGGRGITAPNNAGLANASPGITYTAEAASIPPAAVDDSPRESPTSRIIVGGGGARIIYRD
jgi:hypothetical protein